MNDFHSNSLLINRQLLLKNIALLFSGSAISQALTALALLLMARALGPEKYGLYTSNIVLCAFLSIFFSLGMDTWLLQKGGSQPAQIGTLAGSVLTIKILLGGLWCAILFLLAGNIYSASLASGIFRLAALIIWLDSLFTTFQTLFKAVLRNQFTSTLLVGSDLVWFLGTLILFTSGEQNLAVYMEVRIGVLLISLLAAGLLSWIHFALWPQWLLIKRITHETFTFAASEILALTYVQADVLIVSFTLGKEQVGLYAPALSLVNALFLIPSAIYGVMLPVLSNLFSSNIQRARRFARQLVFIHGLVGTSLTLGLLLLSPFLISLLGSEFADSLIILRILSLNLFFRSLSFALVAILVAFHQQTNRTKVQTIAVLFNIIANLAIVYWAGIVGVAIVYVVTDIILTTGYSLLVYRLNRGRNANNLNHYHPMT